MSEDPRSIEAGLSWAKWVLSVETDQRRSEDEDLAFQDAEGAWPEDVKNLRGAATVAGVPVPARPMISVDTLDEPISLQQSYERQANLSPRIHALTEDADDETAEVMAGIYRAIERDSRAQLARRWAYERTLWAGRGAYRVLCEYDPEGGHKSDQKIVIRRILYQSNVLFDPTAQEPDFRDGLRCMVLYDYPLATYKGKYGKSKLARAEVDQLTELSKADDTEDWVRAGDTPETKTIRVAEDWLIEVEYDEDGRETDRKVFWRTMNAVENLDDWQEWDGHFIPIIPAIGRELQPLKGKRRWFGMVRNARGAVRLTNYGASGAVEMAAIEPKAPWLIEEGVDEGHEAEFQQANVRNLPAIHYKGTNLQGQKANPPARVQVDVSRLGPNLQLLQMGQGFVQSATATRPPALGQDTPAFRSGKAINALQTQSMNANSPYLDNLADISLTYEACVILDLLPKKYDRPGRVARALGIDGKSQLVALNAPFVPNGRRPKLLPNDTPEEQQAAEQMVADPNHPAKMYDLTKGRYGVEVTIGKSYADERQEGMTEMGTILASDPQMMMLVGPEYFKYRGEPWAEKVGKILERQRDHVAPWLSDQPQGQAPNVQALMQENAAMKQALQQAGLEKAGKVVEMQGKYKIAEMQEDAETQRTHEQNEVKMTVAALGSKVETLQNMMQLFMDERARIGAQGHDVAMGAAEAQAEAAQAAQDHSNAMAQAQAGAVQNAALAEQAHAQGLEANQQQAALQPPDQGAEGGQ